MALEPSSNSTLSEILTLVKELPEKKRATLLRHLKLNKAMQAAKKIDAAKKSNITIRDREIANIVHEYRKKKWERQ